MIKKYIRFLLIFKIYVLHINCNHSIKNEKLKFEDYYDYKDYNCINAAGINFKTNIGEGVVERLMRKDCKISKKTSQLIVSNLIDISAQQYFLPKDKTELNYHSILSNMTEEAYIDFLNIVLQVLRLEYINNLETEELDDFIEYDYIFDCPNETLNRHCYISIQKIFFALSKHKFDNDDWWKLLDIDKSSPLKSEKKNTPKINKKSSNQKSKTQHCEKIPEVNKNLECEDYYEYLTPGKSIKLRKNTSESSLQRKNIKSKSESLNSSCNEKTTKTATINSISSKLTDFDIKSFSNKKSSSTLSLKRKLQLDKDKEILKVGQLRQKKKRLKEFEKEEYMDLNLKKIIGKKIKEDSKKYSLFDNITNTDNIIDISKNKHHIEMQLHDVKIRIATFRK